MDRRVETCLECNEDRINLADRGRHDAYGPGGFCGAASGAGTGPLGDSILRNGAYNTTWTDRCMTVNGSWQSTRAEASRSTQVSNLTHCNGRCPANGGSVTHTHGGITITITTAARWLIEPRRMGRAAAST